MSNTENVFEHVRLEEKGIVTRIILNRPDRGNSLTEGLITELHKCLDLIESSEDVRLVVLQATGDRFCMGMDFEEASTRQLTTRDEVRASVETFYLLLERISLLPKVVTCVVEGRVNAGGVGLVAACDIVMATEAASFSLSEIYFGLLPAVVLPFLVRRTGLQPAYFMTITAETLDASQAKEIRLVDELTESPEKSIRRRVIVANRLDSGVINSLKQYSRQLVPLTTETREHAIEQISSLLWNPDTIEGIRNFVKDQSMPWEKS